MTGNAGQSGKVRFGAYELDGAARELRKNGVRVHLQDQPWELLRALVERHGEVVSREELRRRLWPDGTFVDYEQSLNKAVNRLREALCDSADKPRYVETVARRGYRFVGAVERESVRHDASHHSRRWWVTWAVGLVVAGVLVTGLWPVPAPKVRVTQLTNGGGLHDGSLAVYGRRILYTVSERPPRPSGVEIWSIATNGGEPRRERMPFLRGKDRVRIELVDPHHGTILTRADAEDRPWGDLWLSDFDGNNHRRIDVSRGTLTLHSQYFTESVSPDLKTLLRATNGGVVPGGLVARPINGGPERLVVPVDWSRPSDTLWHPSGARIDFSVVKDGQPVLWEVKADGTGLKRLLPEFPGGQNSASWSPDGKRLYFVSAGEIFVRESRHWLGWMRNRWPERLTSGSVQYSVALEDPMTPHVVFATGSMRRGEAKKLNNRTGQFESYIDGVSADCFVYSPDGQWIAYVSFPSQELWKCRRDGSDRVRLENGLRTYTPRWSPDGKRLVFAATGKRTGAEPRRIYELAVESGGAKLIREAGHGADASWSPDGQLLVFESRDLSQGWKGYLYISTLDVKTGRAEMVPGSAYMYSPRWSPDGKHLAAIRSWPNQLSVYDVGTKRWDHTDLGASDFGFPTWSADGRYVYGILKERNRLIRIEVAARKLEEVRTITEFRLTGNAGSGVSWTPEGEPVVLADMSTSEIYRIEVER